MAIGYAQHVLKNAAKMIDRLYCEMVQKGVRFVRADELFSESGDYRSSPIVIIRKPA